MTPLHKTLLDAIADKKTFILSINADMARSIGDIAAGMTEPGKVF